MLTALRVLPLLPRTSIRERVEYVLLFSGMFYVLRKFASLALQSLTEEDEERCKWLVLLALAGDGMVDDSEEKWHRLYNLALAKLKLSEEARRLLNELWKAQREDDGSVEASMRKGALCAQLHLAAFKHDEREMRDAAKVGAFMQLFDAFLTVMNAIPVSSEMPKIVRSLKSSLCSLNSSLCSHKNSRSFLLVSGRSAKSSFISHHAISSSPMLTEGSGSVYLRMRMFLTNVFPVAELPTELTSILFGLSFRGWSDRYFTPSTYTSTTFPVNPFATILTEYQRLSSFV